MSSSKQSKTSSSKGSSPKSQYYAVFLAKFRITMPDPDIPGPRLHHIFFVETNLSDGSGMRFHVTGDITRAVGMTYESKPSHNPEDSATLTSKDFLGYTEANGFRGRWDELLGSLPTPPRQKAYNTATNRTELVKQWEPLTFYAPGEERQPPWKCTEWTNEYALPALWEAGLIVVDIPSDEARDSAADSGV